MKKIVAMSLAASIATSGCQTASKTNQVNADYIPREVLFSNPDITSIKISPDGKFVAYLSEHKGVLNIWVQEFGKPETAKAVTHDSKRGISQFHWTYSSGHLVFAMDAAGDENYGIYTVNVVSGENKEITKPGKAMTNVADASALRPNEVVILTNARDPKYFDYQILNLTTKATTDLFTNKENYSSVMFDQQYNPVVASKSNDDGGSTIFLWSKKEKAFKKKSIIPFEDGLSTSPVHVSHDGSKVLMVDSRGRDKSALVEWDTKTDKTKVLSSNDKADVDDLLVHPKTEKLLYVSANHLKKELKFYDKEFQTHFEYLQKTLGQDISITSMSYEGDQWVVTTNFSDKPVAFYFYDVKTKKIGEAIIARKSLVPYTDRLSPMTPVEIKSRDGLQLVSYLTLAKKPADKSLILLVHGGPWHRDVYGYNAWHQWLSDRGYNVLSVNFRGSTGLGKSFTNAGDKQWGRNMHNDLIDAVNWAVAKGYADAKKVAIVGGSYGGYSALAGITFTPDVFAASVDIVGPSNLETLIAAFPAYWESFKTTLYKRVGDPRTEEGRKLLKERSPLTHVDKIKTPLLILQGANDPRVKKAEADQIYNSMVAKKIPVEYVLFPDEGHGWLRAANNMGANAIIEDFLAKYLKGRAQPFGNHVKESSAQFITTPQ